MSKSPNLSLRKPCTDRLSCAYSYEIIALEMYGIHAHAGATTCNPPIPCVSAPIASTFSLDVLLMTFSLSCSCVSSVSVFSSSSPFSNLVCFISDVVTGFEGVELNSLFFSCKKEKKEIEHCYLNLKENVVPQMLYLCTFSFIPFNLKETLLSILQTPFQSQVVCS